MGEIVNRVSSSSLITVDLEELRPEGKRHLMDISQWLESGFILREKEFRQTLAEHAWSQYKNAFVAVNCTTEAILPAWASLLVATYLQDAQQVVWGNGMALEQFLFSKAIENLDITLYQDQPLLIKGCSDATVPQAAYLQLIRKLQPVAKSLFFGEACSSVPLYKAKK